mgnify:CR=1 FL=1
MEKNVILSLKNVSKTFPVGKSLLGRPTKFVHAVNDVSFDVYEGETFSIVGESGCGKSTTGRLINHLLIPDSGEIWFQGKEISHISQDEMRPIRKDMQMIFQDPAGSLNPRMRVSELIEEPLLIHTDMSAEERAKIVNNLLKIVGLSDKHASRYPHEFSGGQRQRIGIARALSVNPEFLLCDEPISALDVSIQAQVVNVLEDLQQELGLTYLFVAHDLSMVRHISDRIGVMYLGKIVESGESDEVYDNPCHPYTRALLASIPIADPKRALSLEHCGIEGDLPSPLHVPSGCRFHTRCPYATDQCRQQEPELEERTPGHMVACWKK